MNTGHYVVGDVNLVKIIKIIAFKAKMKAHSLVKELKLIAKMHDEHNIKKEQVLCFKCCYVTASG